MYRITNIKVHYPRVYCLRTICKAFGIRQIARIRSRTAKSYTAQPCFEPLCSVAFDTNDEWFNCEWFTAFSCFTAPLNRSVSVVFLCPAFEFRFSKSLFRTLINHAEFWLKRNRRSRFRHTTHQKIVKQKFHFNSFMCNRNFNLL